MTKSLLTKRTKGSIDMYFALDQEPPEDELEADMFLDIRMKSFLENKSYNAVINHYTKNNDLSGICMLIAHGDSYKNKWIYSDSKNDFSVQSWINKKDGQYGLLILRCCNLDAVPVQSKKSAIIFPNMDYSDAMLNDGEVQLELFIPGRGYLDSYEVDAYIQEHNLNV